MVRNIEMEHAESAPASIPEEMKTSVLPCEFKTPRQPVVLLHRLPEKELPLMQKNLSEFVKNKPDLSKKLGISMSDYPRTKLYDEVKQEFGRSLKCSKESQRCSKVRAESSFKNRSRKGSQKIKESGIDEDQKTNLCMAFNVIVDKIFENMEVDDVDFSNEFDDSEVPPEALISKYQIQNLCSEAAKMKSLGNMKYMSSTVLLKLLSILEMNIRDGAQISPMSLDSDENAVSFETAMKRIVRAANASLVASYILTSPNMPKKIYMEDIIERIVLFVKFQLSNTIYPYFDPVYRLVKDKKKKKNCDSHREEKKSMLHLYTKLNCIVGLLAELIEIQILTDTTILHASSMAISPFFVEKVSELQLSALRLVITIFAKYEKHRNLLLEDILTSIIRLPTNKTSLRTYRLNPEENIQMLTALVLQLIQCVVLPVSITQPVAKDETKDVSVDVLNIFKNVLKISGNFLSVFLNKCASKNEDVDYRPLFENFVQDLLTLLNKPEWPAAEVLLSLLGKLLVSNFMNKSVEMPLRLTSLEHIGVISARLRRNSVSRKGFELIDEIFASEDKKMDSEEEKVQFLQCLLLDYLASGSGNDMALNYARHFYLVQWYHDCVLKPKPKISKKRRKKRKRSESSEEEVSDVSDHEDDTVNSKKQFFLSKMKHCDKSKEDRILGTFVNNQRAELISCYLASKRTYFVNFETYMNHILRVLAESSIAIRTKAMKCLRMVVESDPSVLGMKSVQMGVRLSFLDHATSVREGAVDLIGKYILIQPELIDTYYEMLSTRILDTGVSVRKRVIKILRDICIEYPDYPKIPDICVKLIKRVNDEDGIRKLVMEVFHSMWFVPTSDASESVLVRKVMNIVEVVAASMKDMGIEWLEVLLQNLFKSNKDSKAVVEPLKKLITACDQIVNALVKNVLKLEGTQEEGPRLVACFITLYLFAKIRPELLVNHAITLQPYLILKCKTQNDYDIVNNVARILELIIPLLENPSETFLAQLEEDCVKLLLQHDQNVVATCISCLASIVNKVTKNFQLIRDCFRRYYAYLMNFKKMEETQTTLRPYCKRALFTVGLFMRYFDFNDKELRGDLPEIEQVFDTLIFFFNHSCQDIENYAVKAIGFFCVRHYDFMLRKSLKKHYYKYLTKAVPCMRLQVLRNIEIYLEEEVNRMIKQDLEWSVLSKQEDLKEMGDISSGMASTITQVYIKEILDAFLHSDINVRKGALKVIQLILQQGLVHPVQIVPYLICISTDVEKVISHNADKLLKEIDMKYPGFIHSKVEHGIRLSFSLQKILQTDIVRGFRVVEESPEAMNGFVYLILRSTKQQRRALALSVLKQFDEQINASLDQMLYLADNLAYFPYQVQDEPLFIIHHIDIIISLSGMSLLQFFQESLVLSKRIEDEDEDEEFLLSCVPEDLTPLQEIITASQGCILLLILRQHLKCLYGLSDSKIAQYSPSDPSKLYEKIVRRKMNIKFNPESVLLKLNKDLPVVSEKREIVAQYLYFKQLMLNWDPDEEAENQELSENSPKVLCEETPQKHQEAVLEEMSDKKNKTPKLDRRSLFSAKKMKSSRAKKRKKKDIEGSDSDPDFRA